MTEAVFPELLRYAKQWKDPLLSDWYLHERFINGNNSVDFGDIALLIPTVITGSVFFSGEDASGGQFPAERQRLVRDVETTVNAADRFLRENFRLRLFEFFYPPVYRREKREAFPDMERAGRSSCAVEGVRFTQHPPLLDFLENIFRYTEYCFRLKNGFEGGSREPPLGEAWKRVAAAALGLEDRALIPPVSAPPFTAPGKGIALRESRLEKLRADSDVVRELLKIEDESGERETPERETFRIMTRNTPGSGSLDDFVTGLDPAGREALKRLTGNPADPRSELEALAREHHVMPALIIDRINAAFLEQCGDLLIDTVDEQPLVQPEYIEQLRKLLGGA